jgi:Heparinase II/III-like protein/Heparinase II/III N-terminus
MTSIVRRIRARSLDELRVRGTQALHVCLERFADLFIPEPGTTRGGGRTPRIFDDGVGCLTGRRGIDPATIARAIAQRDPQLPARFAERSDAAEGGWISLLGHDPLWVGNPPHWHREAMSAIEAPRLHWSRIDHLDTGVVGDHKLLWELNRHQYLLAPAFCWLLEGETRRLALIESHLESWLADNPPRRGINWVSSLEVGLRAIAWCWLLWMLREAPWRADLRRRLALSLEAHARHIERYLSTYYSPNTHLTGEALALFYVGTLLPDSPHAPGWRRKGAAILESEIGRQVYADGVYFEQAAHYQRYTAEIYLHYLQLANATGWSVPDRTRDRLGRLLEVLCTLASSQGRIPLLGDDDGGQLWPLDHRAPDDVRALLLAGAVALERPELCASVTPASPSYAYWLCGIERTERLAARGARHPSFSDMYFACGGLAVLRDGWERQAAVAVIDAGPHGALSCGHSHADALTMTLALGPTALFIDRGTLTYSGSERDLFRATLSHNTLEIDGISSVDPAGPFKWLAPIPPRACGVVCSSTRFSGFLGTATGHLAGGRASMHRRRILHLRGGAWVIHDRGARAQARAGTLRWQLAPGLSATPLGAQSLAIRDGAGAGVATIFVRGASPVLIVGREVSPRLGSRAVAQCLELETGSALEALTVVIPALPDGALVIPEPEGSLASGAIAWTDANGRHLLLPDGAVHSRTLPPALEGTADLIWRLDGGRDGGDDRGALVAALSQPPAVSHAVQPAAEGARQSGKMSVWAGGGGAWTQVSVEEPRRG